MEPDKMHELLSELSTEEQLVFKQILENLSAVKGDLNQLSEADQLQLAKLANRHYQDEATPDSTESVSEPTANETIEETEFSAVAPEESPTQTDFGQYVVDQVKVLCEGGSSLADAIRYAYHNKYMPTSLRDEQVCKDVLQRHQGDILALAHAFKQLESAHLADAKLLVGFAWFAVIFDCYQYVEAYGELH